ncbi:LuxR C-terminal-related transcriptional regulator [Nocardia fluminea]|uniref:ATP-binding protein n=1 Tax=Nocardia fluminea TaxID=134984 RepID=UPI0033CEE768
MVRNALDPAATSYLGRDAESETVRELLDSSCLVSITGAGGLGKTRLARRLAGELVAAYDSGVFFVELAGLRLPEEVAVAVAAALGLRVGTREATVERVLDHLGRSAPLLVLDNCEHLLDGCADLVARILTDCPGVTVLATSRQTLSVAGEQVFRMPPLAVPAPREDDPARVAEYPAVRLLLDRARAVRSDFRLTAANSADVARLCRLLDGIPLAIELAAARLRSLSPGQVVARWPGGLTLPTAWSHGVPDRHQTLRATVDWSFHLCCGDERRVWACLSVFQDWFELEAAEYVCAGADLGMPVMDLVDSLVDKSILERRGDAAVYYRLLRVVREFGTERLAAAQLSDRVARRHRDWFRELLLLADHEFLGPRQYELVRRLQLAHLDLRLAMEWSLSTTGEAGAALEMAASVEEFWTMAGANHEVHTWLDRALRLAPDSPHAPRGWSMLAMHSLWLTDRDSVYRELDLAETAAGTDPLAVARVLTIRATAAKIELDNVLAANLAGAALRTMPAGSGLRETVFARNTYALATAAAHPQYRLPELRDLVKACAEQGDYYYQTMLLFTISLIEVLVGHPDAAEAAARTALTLTRRWGNTFGDAYHIESLAWVASARNRHHRAATLFGVAAAGWERLGTDPRIILVHPHTLFRDATERALGAGQFAAAFGKGHAMPLEEAVAMALEPQRSHCPGTGSAIAPLTPREYEVAALVASGLTNKEIAARLVIAPRTADTHVGNILTKLDSANRAQIATWVATRGNSVIGT